MGIDQPSSLDELRRELADAVRIADETERLLEVAAIVEEALDGIGVTAVVVGGLAVAYWTRARYTTTEIDFVMPETDEVRRRIADLGFEKTPGRHWIYPGRSLRVISLEDMLLWRTREFLHWRDTRGVRHAIYMLESPRLDRDRLRARAVESGLTDAVNWIAKAAEEIRRGRKFDDWEIKEVAERLERERYDPRP